MNGETVDWRRLRPRVTRKLLNEVVKRIVQRFQPEKVILFGSYAYGRPRAASDVDLFVVMKSDQPVFTRIREVADVAEVPFLPMDIIVRTPEEVSRRIDAADSFIQEILERGRVLYERLE